jgi:transposase
VRKEPLVKRTKKGERTNYRWVASWREGAKTKKVYLGNCRKISQSEALLKVKKLNAAALGFETIHLS